MYYYVWSSGLNFIIIIIFRKNMPFKYLGRYFNFHMDNSDHMSILLDTINDLVLKIDCLLCHPKNKLLLYHRFVLSKLAWHLTIADLSKTWMVDNLDNVISRCEAVARFTYKRDFQLFNLKNI